MQGIPEIDAGQDGEDIGLDEGHEQFERVHRHDREDGERRDRHADARSRTSDRHRLIRPGFKPAVIRGGLSKRGRISACLLQAVVCNCKMQVILLSAFST